MYGSSLGTLNIYQKVGNSIGKPIWSISGDQGQKRTWLKGQVTLNSNVSFNVSESGDDKKNDITVSSLLVTTSRKQPPLESDHLVNNRSVFSVKYCFKNSHSFSTNSPFKYRFIGVKLEMVDSHLYCCRLCLKESGVMGREVILLLMMYQ